MFTLTLLQWQEFTSTSTSFQQSFTSDRASVAFLSPENRRKIICSSHCQSLTGFILYSSVTQHLCVISSELFFTCFHLLRCWLKDSKFYPLTIYSMDKVWVVVKLQCVFPEQCSICRVFEADTTFLLRRYRALSSPLTNGMISKVWMPTVFVQCFFDGRFTISSFQCYVTRTQCFFSVLYYLE